MHINDLPTPAFIVDLERVKANTQYMQEKAARHGVRLRPHMKTHKTLEGAKLQVGDGFKGLTVSTLAEASFYAKNGFRDITYAVPIAPNKLGRVSELQRELDHLHLLLDNEQTLKAIETYAQEHIERFSCFLKIDCGYHRAGVDPQSESAYSLAAQMWASPHIDFQGLLTHGGHSYNCTSREEILAVADEEREVVVNFAEELRARGIPVREVSIGSTPTMSLTENLTGITEIRPGNYMFYDRFQATLGSCDLSQVAISVLTSVIGRYPQRRELITDAGALALSKDPGATHLVKEPGYGSVLGALDLAVKGLSQEHGTLASNQDLGDAYPIGHKLRVVPNHSCMAAALYDRFHVVEKETVVATWSPVRGW